MAYTQAGLSTRPEDFGESTRFIKQYGLPPGRNTLSTTSLDAQYTVKKIIDGGKANGGIGAFNEGVDLVIKNTPPRKGQICVLKRIKIKPREAGVVKREIEILHVLKHPNLVGFVDGYIPANLDGQAHLVMEFCDRGHLGGLIQAYSNRNKVFPDQEPAYMPERWLWHVFESLASALAYIHHGIMGDDLKNPSKPRSNDEWPLILHRDIKPENIFLQSVPSRGGPQHRSSGSRVSQLLSRSEMTSKMASKISSRSSSRSSQASQNDPAYPRVVLADFGVCTQEYEIDWDDTAACTGTLTFMSPEVPDMTARGEVWAVGAVIMSLCLLLEYGPINFTPPNDAEEHEKEPRKWAQNPKARRGVRDTYLGSQYSKDLRDTVRKALRFKAENRPKSFQLLDNVRTCRGRAEVRFEALPRWAFKNE